MNHELRPPRRPGAGHPAGRAGQHPRMRSPTSAGRIGDIEKLVNENPVVKARLRGRRVPGPGRLHGARDHRPGAALHRPAARPAQEQPYCGYETYDFDVPTRDTCDAYGRMRIRIEGDVQSLQIVEQCVDRLQADGPGPVMIADKKIAWPAQLALGGDGMGNSLDHIRTIMGDLDGGADPPLQAGHRGFPGACRAGVPGGRVSTRRARCAPGLRRWHPARTGRTSGIRRSPTCRRWRRCARAARWPTSSSRWRRSTR